MPKFKFGIDGVGAVAESGFYDGPPPTPGVYQGKLKRLELTKIQNGPNKGSPRLRLLAEITGPKGNKFIGAGVWDGLNVTEQGKGYVNNFLRALSDGTEEGAKKLEVAFWRTGIVVDSDGHVQKIGTVKIESPDGEKEVHFVVRKGKDQDGNPQAKIGRWLAPTSDEDDEDDEDEDDDLDGVEEDTDDDVDEDEDDADTPF